MDIPSWVWLPVAIVPYIVIFFLFIVWVSDSDYPSAKRLRSIWSGGRDRKPDKGTAMIAETDESLQKHWAEQEREAQEIRPSDRGRS